MYYFSYTFRFRQNSILPCRNKKLVISRDILFSPHKYFLVDITVKNIFTNFCLYECITKLYVVRSIKYTNIFASKNTWDSNMHVDESRERIQCGHIIAVERIQWVDCELREARGGLTPRRLITSFLVLARSQS